MGAFKGVFGAENGLYVVLEVMVISVVECSYYRVTIILYGIIADFTFKKFEKGIPCIKVDGL